MNAGAPIPDLSERLPPDVGDDYVVVPPPDGTAARLTAYVAQRIDAPTIGFRDVGIRMDHPIRHRFELSVAGDDLQEPLHPRRDDEEWRRRQSSRQAAMTMLRAEHAPPMPSDVDFEPTPKCGEVTAGNGRLLVGHLVIDEFRRRDVRAPRDGEMWFWHLDADETPEYTTMEALVRDVVDLWQLRGITPMRGGSLWWVRSLHVHPRCRGHQLGGRLLGYALWALRRGPYDLVVLEAHPEPTIFAPPGAPTAPGFADWGAYGRSSPAAVAGLVRYFGRMGFMRVDDAATGLGRVQHIDDEEDHELSRRMHVYEDGPEKPGEAVAMYAFLGDLQFRDGDRPGPKLGRRVQASVPCR